MLEKLDNKVQKNKVGILYYIMHQNELKMNERSRHKTWNSKTIRKQGKSFWTLDLAMISWIQHKSTGNRSKKRQWDYIKLKNFWVSKETINRAKVNLFIEIKCLQTIYQIMVDTESMQGTSTAKQQKTLILKNEQKTWTIIQ